jgi:hypothetical protein
VTGDTPDGSLRTRACVLGARYPRLVGGTAAPSTRSVALDEAMLLAFGLVHA